MPTKKPENFQYLSNDPDFIPDPEINEFINEEITRAPKDLHAAPAPNAEEGADAKSPDSEDVGDESFYGDNPTPDQSDTEENARSFGVTYEDTEDLEFEEKINRRDRDRFELDPRSKTEDDTV